MTSVLLSQKMDSSGEYIQMEMECEPKKSIQRGRPCGRQTGILVLLGTVCMIIFMVMIFVIFSHQERKFSMLESWMNSHTSDLTSVKSDFQITGNDLEKKADELQTLVSIMSSHLNMSGSNHSMAREMQEKKLSNIETMMTELISSLSSLASKQEENLKKLAEHEQGASYTEVKSSMDSLRHSLSEIESQLTMNHFSSIQLIRISNSVMHLHRAMGLLMSSVQSLHYKLAYINLLIPGCNGAGWIPFSNSCYLFSHDKMNWTEANDYCEEQGTFFLKIDSEKEWSFVTNMAKPHEYWIGLTDQTTDQWRWADDTPYTMNKEHWETGQPDNWQGHEKEGGEECAHLNANGKLNDNHCSVKLQFICKGSKNA